MHQHIWAQKFVVHATHGGTYSGPYPPQVMKIDGYFCQICLKEQK